MNTRDDITFMLDQPIGKPPFKLRLRANQIQQVRTDTLAVLPNTLAGSLLARLHLLLQAEQVLLVWPGCFVPVAGDVKVGSSLRTLVNNVKRFT